MPVIWCNASCLIWTLGKSILPPETESQTFVKVTTHNSTANNNISTLFVILITPKTDQYGTYAQCHNSRFIGPENFKQQAKTD